MFGHFGLSKRRLKDGWGVPRGHLAAVCSVLVGGLRGVVLRVGGGRFCSRLFFVCACSCLVWVGVASVGQLSQRLPETQEGHSRYTIMSFGDGQVLSIANKESNKYNIRLNNGCLGFENGKFHLSDCTTSKVNLFELHNVNDQK